MQSSEQAEYCHHAIGVLLGPNWEFYERARDAGPDYLYHIGFTVKVPYGCDTPKATILEQIENKIQGSAIYKEALESKDQEIADLRKQLATTQRELRDMEQFKIHWELEYTLRHGKEINTTIDSDSLR